MSLQVSCYALYHHNRHSFISRLDIVLIQSNNNHRDRLDGVIPLEKESLYFQIISVNFFQKTRIEDYFTFSILDLDLRLKLGTILQNLIKFLFLNGIGIAVVTIAGLHNM